MTAKTARSPSRWLKPESYARGQAPPAVERQGRFSQEAFERAVARELAGDCC